MSTYPCPGCEYARERRDRWTGAWWHECRSPVGCVHEQEEDDRDERDCELGDDEVKS